MDLIMLGKELNTSEVGNKLVRNGSWKPSLEFIISIFEACGESTDIGP